MTQRSTLEATAKIPLSRLYGVGVYRINGSAIDYPISWDDFEQDVTWAMEMFRLYGIERGRVTLLISSGHEAAQLEPAWDALRHLGGTIAPADTFVFDAGRSEMITRWLEPHLIAGINADVVGGISKIVDLSKRFGSVPHILARPDAIEPLREAGLRPKLIATIGPALGIACPQGDGAHVNAKAWTISSTNGELRLTSAPSRAFQVTDAPSGFSGSVITDPCECGRSDPRVLPA